MRGLCFNLRIDVPVDGHNAFFFRLPAIKALFNQGDYDFIALQEVNDSMRSALLKELPSYQAIGESRDQRGEQTPIFYHTARVIILQSETIWLTKTPHVESVIEGSFFPRIATIATMQSLITKTMITVINTHLDYANESVQSEQMHWLLDYLKKSDYPKPYLLMGDFNATLTASVHDCIKNTVIGDDFFKSIYQEANPQKTFHGFLGGVEGEPIDYIYTTLNPNQCPYLVIRERFLDCWVSDHYPISVEIIESKEAR